MPQVTQLQRSGLRFKSKSDSEASASGSPPPPRFPTMEALSPGLPFPPACQRALIKHPPSSSQKPRSLPPQSLQSGWGYQNSSDA